MLLPGGAVSVSKLQLRYRPGLPLVLKGVSFDVAAGEKVGLVGRTGSGKSSLLLALFRMVEPEHGTISIDGVDIARLGLKQLRSAMSIIPQDPFMFSGTVRHNLDPFRGHGDDELWEVLGAVGLKDVISGEEVEGGGRSMYQGM
jgi:ABC-type multidrug transport system fused ATPase/permease subunit